jgi:hypothetical protein
VDIGENSSHCFYPKGGKVDYAVKKDILGSILADTAWPSTMELPRQALAYLAIVMKKAQSVLDALRCVYGSTSSSTMP